MFSPDMIDAVKIQFLSPIFEEDFTERGMKAWLTKIELCEKKYCYRLFFDFKDFEKENDKYFTECFYENRYTDGTKELYTAKESGNYNHKYNVYFGDLLKNNENENMKDLENYIKAIDKS